MIEADQVQNAMEHENPNFVAHRVPEFLCLSAGPIDRNGHFTQIFRRLRVLWERKHVGGGIVSAELPVQTSEFIITSDQAAEGAALSQIALQAACEGQQFTPAKTASGSTKQDGSTFSGHRGRAIESRRCPE